MDNNFNNPDMSTVQLDMSQGGMPQAPQSGMPQAPQMGMPQAPQMGMPQAPQSGMPQAPQMGMPQAPQMGMPQAPQMGMPQAPQMGMPQAPQMEMPQQPQGGMPQPGMGMAPGMAQQPFGQPGMGMPQQPQQPAGKKVKAPKAPKAPKVKKPMTGGKIAAIIGGSVAGVAAIVCGIIFIPKLFKPAKDVVVEAFENTFVTEGNDMSAGSYLQEKADIEAIMNAFYTTGGEHDMTITINEVYGEGGLEDYSFSLTENYDPVNLLANYNVGFTYQDESFLALNIIGTEDTTYFEIVDAIEAYFSLPNENVVSTLQDSPLGESMDLYGVSDFSIDYFSMSQATDIDAGAVAAGEELWDSVVVEKEGSAKIDVNGETVKAKEYSVTLKEDDIIAAIEKYLDNLDPAMVAQLEAEGVTVAQMKTMISSIVTSDFVVKVYIKDDKVVKITSEDDITLFGVKMNYEFFFDIDDKDMSGEFSFSAMGEGVTVTFECADYATAPTGSIILEAGGEEATISFETVSEISDKVENIDFNMTVDFEGEEIGTIDIVTNIDKSDDTFEGEISFSAEEYGDYYVEYAGEFTEFNKGVGYTEEFEYIDIYVEDEKVVSIGATYSIDTSSVDAEDIDPSYPVHEIATTTSDDLYDIIFVDNYDAMDDWLNNLLYNTGDLGTVIESALWEIIYGSYEDDYYDDDDYYDEPDYNVTYTDEELTLSTLNADVQITGCVEGFELDFAVQGSYVDYYTDALSRVTYYLEEAESADAVLDSYASYFPTGDDGTMIYQSLIRGTLTIADGSDVASQSMQYDSYGYKVSAYTFVKEVAPGVYLVTDCYIYDDDDSYDLQTLAETLNSQNYILK